MTPPVRQPTILTRTSFLPEGQPLSSTQAQVDGGVGAFVEEAANPRTLAALTVGGMAYRLGRIGVMSMGVGAYGRTSVLVVSTAVGLGSEVTVFEFTNRALQTVRAHGRAPLQTNYSNLWSWSGPGGWRDGLVSSAISFGMLRGAGFLAREQNLIFQHAFQSTAMVAGHNAAGLFGVSSRPEGTLAEQFLHAEATNLQMGAGMSLLHSFAPGIHALERGLDVTLSSVGAHGRAPSIADQNISERFLPQTVTEGPHGPSEGPQRPWPIMMANMGSGNDPTFPKLESSPVVSESSSTSARVFKNPVEAFRPNLPRLSDYKIGETYTIAEEEGSRLTATVREGPIYVFGSTVKMDYFLNGESVGWRTYQLIPEKETFRAGKIDVNPDRQNQGLGKMILMHDLYQIHRMGWTFLQLITNPIMVHTAVKTRYQGERIFEPGTMIQLQMQNFDPWEPEMINIGDPMPLEKFDPEGLAIGNNAAYLLTGRPNPKVFEPLAGPPRISRVMKSSTGAEHPFELLLPDWQQIAQAPEGAQFPIAEREGRTIMIRLLRRQNAEYMDFFAKDGTPELHFEISEGEAWGRMVLFLPPGAITRHEIHTLGNPKIGIPPLPPGGGSIITEWLATQAALHGLDFNILEIKNPQIIRILSQRQLMDLEATKVEVCYWNHYWMLLGAVDKITDLKDPESLKNILQQNPLEGPSHKFLMVKGRPNPELVPPHLRSPRR